MPRGPITDNCLGLLKIEELTFKNKLITRLALEYGARGIWLSKRSSASLFAPSDCANEWIKIVGEFEEVLLSPSSADDISTWRITENPTLETILEKVAFVLPEDESSAIAPAKNLKFCREIVIIKEDYQFSYESSRFTIFHSPFTSENSADQPDKDAASVNCQPPIHRYLVSFSDDPAHVEHRRELFRECDLFRAFLIKRSTSCPLSANRYPRHLLFHRIPIYLTSSVSSGRQYNGFVRQTLADGVVVDSAVVFDNPAVFAQKGGKPFAPIADVLEKLRGYLSESGAEKSIVEWKETLSEFLRRRADAFTLARANKKGPDIGSAEVISFLSDSLSKFGEIDTVENLANLLDDLLKNISGVTTSFISSACFSPGNGLGQSLSLQQQQMQKPSGLESLKTEKKTKEQKFEEKKHKLKENTRRKREIGKLRKRFVRTRNYNCKQRDDENDSDHDDDEDDEPENMEDIVEGDESEPQQQQQGGIRLRRAETQTLERQRIRSALSAAYSDQELKNVLKITIDLSFGDNVMTDKEMGRLAIQIRRIYGSNRQLCESGSNSTPARLDLFGLGAPSPMREKLRSKFTGFELAVLGKSEETDPKAIYGDSANDLEFVVLTPDSDNTLTELSTSRVYILGGLVDESVTKNITLAKSIGWNYTTARLPIQEFMERTTRDVKCGTSFNPVLTVNQVFDILVSVFKDGDWPKALAASVPMRKGFILKPSHSF